LACDRVCGDVGHDGRRLRLSVADARNLAEGALRGIGYRHEEARIISAECRRRSLLTATDEIA
jgi:hypothetical protein